MSKTGRNIAKQFTRLRLAWIVLYLIMFTIILFVLMTSRSSQYDAFYRWLYVHIHPHKSVGIPSNEEFWHPIYSSYASLLFIVPTFVLIIIHFFVISLLNKWQAKLLRKQVLQMMGGQEAISANDYLALRQATKADSQSEFTGIYILRNLNNGMCYVGQSVRVMSRVQQHLTGHGNGDVYADYKHGDDFTVQTISLAASGYDSLNDLERDAIFTYDAFNSGYNRTRGNRR